MADDIHDHQKLLISWSDLDPDFLKHFSELDHKSSHFIQQAVYLNTDYSHLHHKHLNDPSLLSQL